MKTLAFLVAAVCIVASVLHGGSLPTFMLGYAVDSTRIHLLHGFAALTGGVVFLLISLSMTPIAGSLDRRTRFK